MSIASNYFQGIFKASDEGDTYVIFDKSEIEYFATYE